MSQLWSLVVVLLSVFVLGGRRGQLPGCEGEGGPVSFGVVFCGEWRRVSFRGCEGGSGASQLWSCLVLRGMEASQLPGAVKGG